jgi:FkbM family methyltransferase
MSTLRRIKARVPARIKARVPARIKDVVRGPYARHCPQRSFSQTGEDLLIRFIFNDLGVEHPSYLDVGAYRPFHLNNTALFYLGGSRGINVDPDPDAIAAFERQRPHDININLGCAAQRGRLTFHRMTEATLSTFSSEAALEAVRESDGRIQIEATRPVDVVTVADILNKHGGQVPDFLSLDVEGLDLEIVASIEDWPGKPTVVCVETITYSEHGHGVKITEIGDLLSKHGYMPFADTYINTIFVLQDRWRNRS